MTTHSTDLRLLRSEEGQRIYRALFRREIPTILLERYLVAAEQIDGALDEGESAAYYRAVAAQDDLEALEFAARLTGRLPLLSRKFQAMAYLAETLPDHQAYFVAENTSRLKGFAALAASALQAVVLGSRGLAAVRRLPHD
jgi:hypothetical protein